jgi:hypothetical protein
VPEASLRVTTECIFEINFRSSEEVELTEESARALGLDASYAGALALVSEEQRTTFFLQRSHLRRVLASR